LIYCKAYRYFWRFVIGLSTRRPTKESITIYWFKSYNIDQIKQLISRPVKSIKNLKINNDHDKSSKSQPLPQVCSALSRGAESHLGLPYHQRDSVGKGGTRILWCSGWEEDTEAFPRRDDPRTDSPINSVSPGPAWRWNQKGCPQNVHYRNQPQ